ncbi:MAG: ABC transporter substrate-binding protein [Atopobiaceae bacterium]|jgi:iron complex transport system substrate-binding protein|nr:ABC transporter substrate-binding protein [Atopobiaceae bacterium]
MLNDSRLVRPAAVAATLLLASSLVALPACSQTSTTTSSSDAQSTSAASDTQSVTFTDDLGREVTLSNSQRVVACMGSFAGAWQLAGGTLVGASDDAFAHYGVDSATVAGVGKSTALNLESILDLDPDFVIMTGISDGKHATGVSQEDMETALGEAGVPVAFFKVTTFADYERVMGIFCQITGRDDLYQQHVAAVKSQIDDDIQTYSVAGRAPTVLVVSAYSKGLVVQDSSGMAGVIVRDLGAVNVADENPSLLSDFSLEAAIEADPDYILVLAASDDEQTAQQYYEDAVGSDSAWADMAAVREGRVTMLDAAHFLYKPLDKWAESYEIVGQALSK